MTKEEINKGMEALWRYVRRLGRLNGSSGWIGLNEYELNREANLSVDYYTFKAGALWAEQRLKEKNHGN